MRYLFITLLFFLCSISIGGTIDPNKTDDRYIDYGKKFACVYKLRCMTNDGILYYASAVAIDDNWILTAAHVLSNSKDTKIIIGDEIINVDKIITHKNFVFANYGYYDIALCHVEKSFNLNFYPELYTDKDEIGKVCSVAGFGYYGTFKTGAVSSDGNRRAGSNIIESIDRQLLICKPSKPNDGNITELEFMIANGDSGGGLFIQNKLAGINSCVMAVDKKTDSNYGDEGCHTRISLFVDWIKSNKK